MWATDILPVDRQSYLVEFVRFEAAQKAGFFRYVLMRLDGTPVVVTHATRSNLAFVSGGRAYAPVVRDDGQTEVEVYGLPRVAMKSPS